MERIPAEDWWQHRGHCDRYMMAAEMVDRGNRVLDAACGVGYGAVLLAAAGADYTGVDQPGVTSWRFHHLGDFIEVDLMDWQPAGHFDLGVSFETLEHVTDPQRLADMLDRHCDRLIVSTPTVPTTHFNEHHLHDFTLDDLLGLFPRRTPERIVPQPEELAHIVVFA